MDSGIIIAVIGTICGIMIIVLIGILKKRKKGAKLQSSAVSFGNVTANRDAIVERNEAIEWWIETGKESALCDDCRATLKKGDGYMVGERILAIGDEGHQITLSPSL